MDKNGRRGPSGGSGARARRPYSVDGLTVVAMPVAQDVSPRLIPLVVSLVPRLLLGFSHYLRVSDPRAAGAPSGRDGRTGRASLQRGWRWRGQCEPRHGPCRAYGGGRTAFGRGCIRGALLILSSRAAAGYARRGILLLMLLHCRFSCVRVVFSMFSLLHFGFGPRCSSRYARRWTGGHSGRASIRILGCACRGMRGLASAVASAVDVPDSSRL